jgi:hypothetical protein
MLPKSSHAFVADDDNAASVFISESSIGVHLWYVFAWGMWIVNLKSEPETRDKPCKVTI